MKWKEENKKRLLPQAALENHSYPDQKFLKLFAFTYMYDGGDILNHKF